MLQKLAAALTLGGIGGAIAHWIDIPLAWMLGPIMATFAASMVGLPVAVPMNLRAAMLGVLGVFLGSSFTPEVLHGIALWPWSVVAVLLYVPILTLLTAAYYQRIARIDRTTALFASAPGALTPMIILGAAAGGNEQRIAFIQSLRVMLLVFAAPLIVSLLGGDSNRAPGASVDALISWDDAILLGIVAGIGATAARLLRTPAAPMIGAMFASALLYTTGIVEGALPAWLLAGTLLVLGAAIGSRFSNVGRGVLLHLSGHAVVATALILAVTAVASLVVAFPLGLDYIAVLLSFAPGGVAEMCLIALALDIEPGFVAIHHLARIFEIIFLAPFVARHLVKFQN